MTIQEFCARYHHLYQQLVSVTLRDGAVVEGGYYDEFLEEGSILISEIGPGVQIIPIQEIEKLEPLP